MLSKRKLEWLISNKMDFRTRKINKDREGYSIVIKKKSVHQEIAILNIFTFSNRASKNT